MKKKHLFMSAMVIILIINSISLGAIEKRNYDFDIEKFIVQYYQSKDIFNESIAKQDFSNDEVYAYAEGKIKVNEHIKEKISSYKTNYSVNTELLEKNQMGDKTYYRYAVVVKFRYDGAKFDSSYGEEIEIIVNNDNKVENIYVALDYYDVFMKGYEYDVKLNIKNNNQKITAFSNLESRVNDLIEQIDNEYDKMIQSDEIYQHSYELTSNPPAFPLNRSNIVTWARNNYNKVNPQSGGSGVFYYDFSQIPEAWDCTNFVSHALLAGGASVYNNNTPSTGWYYVNLSQRSYSWAGVPNFHTFITRKNVTRGPIGESFAYTFVSQNNMPYQTGDLIQFYSSRINNWRHSAVITGHAWFVGMPSGTRDALITGRSGVNFFDDNIRASERYPGEPKRVIRLLGNYF
ncbi:putative amidase-like protein [Natranaerovirga hydrolytica]|uniref:Putative amidase-like protein n=1 Tax=Natranaerovirga hydrolytica TaxID=680378 RepID=A0A4R1N0N4_9FIRM|nr:amidase domain-containing protein [Natranaerovirga hydrolytica]TCK98442.1 putative amidase-like protein [Natranaerovirga hydrolytica]